MRDQGHFDSMEGDKHTRSCHPSRLAWVTRAPWAPSGHLPQELLQAHAWLPGRPSACLRRGERSCSARRNRCMGMGTFMSGAPKPLCMLTLSFR